MNRVRCHNNPRVTERIVAGDSLYRTLHRNAGSACFSPEDTNQPNRKSTREALTDHLHFADKQALATILHKAEIFVVKASHRLGKNRTSLAVAGRLLYAYCHVLQSEHSVADNDQHCHEGMVCASPS
jgi:transcriptional regulator with GAF, ATPase, and Fis domain